MLKKCFAFFFGIKVKFLKKIKYMRKKSFIKNPEIFQGEKYLNSNKNYFEGWYFKFNNCEEGISFIPGINTDENEKKAFIQVITNKESYFVNYNINDFKFKAKPFEIQIGKNIFSKSGININIEDNSQKLIITGNLKFSNRRNIETNALNPNIMGPFSYIPFMECNHAILCMKNTTNGSININDKIINLNNSSGYIEKDWGCSFPKKYIWCQGNNFSTENSSFMLAIADIPFELFNFRGIICDLIIDKSEYRFATYNNTKILEYTIMEDYIIINLKRKNYYLNLKVTYDKGNKLFAPVKGKMSKDILESICSTIEVTLIKDNKIIFSDTSKNCGLEIV